MVSTAMCSRMAILLSCADKLEVFLKHENDQQQVEAAYKRVLDLYDIKVTVKTYLDKYKKISHGVYDF